jgi:phasin
MSLKRGTDAVSDGVFKIEQTRSGSDGHYGDVLIPASCRHLDGTPVVRRARRHRKPPTGHALWMSDTMDTTSETASAAEATDLIKNSYAMAAKNAHDYNNKLLEFVKANTSSAFDFAEKLLGVKSPSEFMELSNEHTRKQLETLTGQIKELAELGQKLTLATTEPLKTGITKVFGRAA